jgi:hypothetical protein
MPEKSTNENYIELFDVTKKQSVTKAPLAEIRFIPRKGERIFISLKGPGDWSSYTVVDVEYFLSHDPSGGHTFTSTVGKVTLYVEESK